MTEQTPPPGTDEAAPLDHANQDSAAPVDEPATHTGVPSVDAVLSEIDGLDQLPLEDHLAAFERAHQALRSALDAPDEPA